MIIYQIKLPKTQDAEAFVTFMNKEYFPAVHKGPSRVGQVIDLRLLQRENELEGDDVGNEFAWHVGWSGQPTGEVHVRGRVQRVVGFSQRIFGDLSTIDFSSFPCSWRVILRLTVKKQLPINKEVP